MKRNLLSFLLLSVALTMSAQSLVKVKYQGAKPTITDFVSAYLAPAAADDEEAMECDGEAVATFAFLPQPEPTYETIVGEWETTSEPYHVIHRIAKCGQQQGIMRAIMEFCMERCRHLRVDTHRENHIMQHLRLKFGFRYRGIIYLQNGDERLAYQLILPPRTS